VVVDARWYSPVLILFQFLPASTFVQRTYNGTPAMTVAMPAILKSRSMRHRWQLSPTERRSTAVQEGRAHTIGSGPLRIPPAKDHHRADCQGAKDGENDTAVNDQFLEAAERIRTDAIGSVVGWHSRESRSGRRFSRSRQESLHRRPWHSTRGVRPHHRAHGSAMRGREGPLPRGAC